MLQPEQQMQRSCGRAEPGCVRGRKDAGVATAWVWEKDSERLQALDHMRPVGFGKEFLSLRLCWPIQEPVAPPILKLKCNEKFGSSVEAGTFYCVLLVGM